MLNNKRKCVIHEISVNTYLELVKTVRKRLSEITDRQPDLCVETKIVPDSKLS